MELRQRCSSGALVSTNRMLALVTASQIAWASVAFLLPFNVGFYISRWHQAHGMPERLELARPMMRRSTGLDPTRHGDSFSKNART
jgi:hypothetical protein